MRLRIRFTKLGRVRFIGHRDVARVWERSLRKAGLPMAYTEGFSPRPKMHFGLALSTGYESVGEYLDIDLDAAEGEIDLEDLPERLTAALPEGIEVQTVALTPSIGATSLQQAITSCTWRIELCDTTVEEASQAAEQLLARTTVTVTRKRKGKDVTDDLRPYLHHLEVTGSDDGVTLIAELGTQPRSVRPAELLAALEPPLAEKSVCRMHQWIASDGQRQEPLPSRPRAEVGAP